MRVQRVRWITAVATLLLAALHGEARAQVGPGPSFTFSPQPVSYGGQAGYAVGTGAMTYVSEGGAMPGGYVDTAQPYFAGDGIPCADGSCAGAGSYGAAAGHARRHHLGSGLASVLSWLAPYNEGGCCAPHWFDFHAEAVFMDLDNNGPSIVFSRDTSGADRITSGDLGYDDEAGLRVTGAMQTGPGSNLEFTYLGVFDFEQTRQAAGDENLLSVFSDFTDLNPPAGLEQFDLANYHEVKLANNMDSFELNYRRRWIGPTCLVQGSWLAGVRYVRVDEKLRWFSAVERDATGDGIPDTGGEGYYNLDTTNDMTGFQLGGDTWVCLLPGLHVGLDGKAGIYGNNTKQSTDIFSIDFVDNFIGIVPSEREREDRVSFVGELNLLLTYRVNQNFTLRGGYEMVFIDGVSLALENFNPDIPTLTTRTAVLNDRGTLFYDGFAIGAEWMW